MENVIGNIAENRTEQTLDSIAEKESTGLRVGFVGKAVVYAAVVAAMVFGAADAVAAGPSDYEKKFDSSVNIQMVGEESAVDDYFLEHGIDPSTWLINPPLMSEMQSETQIIPLPSETQAASHPIDAGSYNSGGFDKEDEQIGDNNTVALDKNAKSAAKKDSGKEKKTQVTIEKKETKEKKDLEQKAKDEQKPEAITSSVKYDSASQILKPEEVSDLSINTRGSFGEKAKDILVPGYLGVQATDLKYDNLIAANIAAGKHGGAAWYGWEKILTEVVNPEKKADYGMKRVPGINQLTREKREEKAAKTLMDAIARASSRTATFGDISMLAIADADTNATAMQIKKKVYAELPASIDFISADRSCMVDATTGWLGYNGKDSNHSQAISCATYVRNISTSVKFMRGKGHMPGVIEQKK